jgi:uncharacterized protein (UPF0335 family)
MAKKTQAKNYNIAIMQPTELNALKALVKEFVGKIESVDSEVEMLKEGRKEIIEEYSEKLDIKTLQAALKTIKIKSEVIHSDTFDMFIEVLTDPAS